MRCVDRATRSRGSRDADFGVRRHCLRDRGASSGTRAVGMVVLRQIASATLPKEGRRCGICHLAGEGEALHPAARQPVVGRGNPVLVCVFGDDGFAGCLGRASPRPPARALKNPSGSLLLLRLRPARKCDPLPGMRCSLQGCESSRCKSGRWELTISPRSHVRRSDKVTHGNESSDVNVLVGEGQNPLSPTQCGNREARRHPVQLAAYRPAESAKVAADRPGLKPYCGNAAVRNFREVRGNGYFPPDLMTRISARLRFL